MFEWEDGFATDRDAIDEFLATMARGSAGSALSGDRCLVVSYALSLLAITSVGLAMGRPSPQCSLAPLNGMAVRA